MRCLLPLLMLHFVHPQIINSQNKTDKELWEEYRKTYQKQYSQQEMEYRFQIFLKNLRLLEDEPTFESADGKVLLGASPMARSRPKMYRKGINQFVDLSDQEFANYYLNPYLNVRYYRRGRYEINFVGPSMPQPQFMFGRFL